MGNSEHRSYLGQFPRNAAKGWSSSEDLMKSRQGTGQPCSLLPKKGSTAEPDLI